MISALKVNQSIQSNVWNEPSGRMGLFIRIARSSNFSRTLELFRLGLNRRAPRRASEFVMPGQKREARLRARCPGHLRLASIAARKTWMAGQRRADATPSFGGLC